MEQKKETRAQLERRVRNSLVFVPRDKDYSSIYFSDRGLRLESTSEYCVISTGFHRHVFDAFNSAQGVGNFISRPYLYTKRVIEIADENLKDIEVDGGYSFQRLLEVLKAKEDKSEYNIVTYVSWWLEIIFAPLYSIDESEAGSFLVYEAYLHHIARQAVLLSEKKEDMTNKQFFDDVIKNMQDFINGVDERVIFHKMTDEEVMKENIEAAASLEAEDAMEAQINGGQD